MWLVCRLHFSSAWSTPSLDCTGKFVLSSPDDKKTEDEESQQGKDLLFDLSKVSFFKHHLFLLTFLSTVQGPIHSNSRIVTWHALHMRTPRPPPLSITPPSRDCDVYLPTSLAAVNRSRHSLLFLSPFSPYNFPFHLVTVLLITAEPVEDRGETSSPVGGAPSW